MRKVLSFLCLVGGVMLILLGFDLSDSLVAELTRFLSRAHSTKAIVFLTAGGALILMGLLGLSRHTNEHT